MMLKLSAAADDRDTRLRLSQSREAVMECQVWLVLMGVLCAQQTGHVPRVQLWLERVQRTSGALAGRRRAVCSASPLRWACPAHHGR